MQTTGYYKYHFRMLNYHHIVSEVKILNFTLCEQTEILEPEQASALDLPLFAYFGEPPLDTMSNRYSPDDQCAKQLHVIDSAG
jgi:hypothetical protein